MSIETDFGETVKARRRALRLRQHNIAQLMASKGYPMHQTTVAKLESGARRTSVGEVVTLAQILNVPPSDLIGGIASSGAGSDHACLSRAKVALSAISGVLAQWDEERLDLDTEATQ